MSYNTAFPVVGHGHSDGAFPMPRGGEPRENRKQQLERLTRDADAIVSRAEAEERDLHPEEQARVTALLTERQVVYEAGQTGGRMPGVPAQPSEQWLDLETDKPVLVLDRSRSYADVVHARNPGVELEPNAMGRMLRALGTGSWRGAHDVKAAMGGNVNTGGGYLVPDHISAEIIDKARAKSVMFKAGMRIVEMSSDSLSIARVITDPTMTEKTENDAWTATAAAFDSITLNAATIGCVVDASRELAADAPNFPQLIEDVLARALAAELDRMALVGDGSAERAGVIVLAGQSTALSASLDYDALMDAVEDVEDYNGDPNAYILSPANKTVLDKLVVASEARNYITAPKSIAALQRLITTSMPDTSCFVGNFATMLMGVRQEARVEITESGGDRFNKHQLGFKISWRGSFAAEHANWLVDINSIT